MGYRVSIGNDAAKEPYRDPNSDDPKLVRYIEHEGEFVTKFSVPDGVGLAEAFQTIIKGLEFHMVEGGQPKWIEGDNIDLVTMLKSYYGVSKARPKSWGTKNKPTGGKES